MSSTPVWMRWARVYAYGFGIIGFGVLLYKYLTPTEEQLIERFSPEVRAHYEHNKALRQQEQRELIEIVKRTSESNDPIWKTDKIKSPFERDGRGVDPKLVDRTQFFKDKEDAKRKQEVERANADLADVEQLVSKSKKSWWKFW